MSFRGYSRGISIPEQLLEWRSLTITFGMTAPHRLRLAAWRLGVHSSWAASDVARLEPRRAPPYNSPHLFTHAVAKARRDTFPRGTPLSDKAEHPPLPEAFAAMGIRPAILRALAQLKFEKPSEIQHLLI